MVEIPEGKSAEDVIDWNALIDAQFETDHDSYEVRDVEPIGGEHDV